MFICNWNKLWSAKIFLKQHIWEHKEVFTFFSFYGTLFPAVSNAQVQLYWFILTPESFSRTTTNHAPRDVVLCLGNKYIYICILSERGVRLSVNTRVGFRAFFLAIIQSGDRANVNGKCACHLHKAWAHG